MDNDEYNEKLLIGYEDVEGGYIWVMPRCHCGRFVKRGAVQQNKLGDVRLVNWNCKKHGGIEPSWFRS